MLQNNAMQIRNLNAMHLIDIDIYIYTYDTMHAQYKPTQYISHKNQHFIAMQYETVSNNWVQNRTIYSHYTKRVQED